MKLIEKDPILVIDLKTLKLQPANTNEKKIGQSIARRLSNNLRNVHTTGVKVRSGIEQSPVTLPSVCLIHSLISVG